jgi:predicted alpha/beta superfamily hydrolase
MKRLVILLAAACARTEGPPSFEADAGVATSTPDAHTVTSQADGAVVVSSPDAAIAPSPDAGTTLGKPTTIRVHYPAAGHGLMIRGSGAGLDWSANEPMAGVGDTFTYTIAATKMTGPIEWKPLLDGATWARGPNYHVGPGDTIDVYPHFNQPTGRVVTLISSFHSNILDNDRPIYAYLPASYDENTDATFPVVYMHDGQNLWAALPQLAFGATWNVDTAFDDAAEHGTCSGWGAQPLGGSPTMCTGDGDCGSGVCQTFPEAIVIGVANTGGARIYEYTPTVDPTETSLGPAGGADLYIKMLTDELKPQIDGMLRTRPDVKSTAMAGSSLGGLVTAYAGTKRADVFGLLGVISPSTWWDNDVLLTEVAATPASPRPLMVYVDSGAGTADDEADTDQLAAAYVTLGYQDGKDFRHVVQSGASHNEVYWAERLPGALQLLLGTR